MKTITKTVYTYKELKEVDKPNSVERAAQWLRNYNTQEDWWWAVYTDWKQALTQIGFENADISFSGFSCQGDGASFTANINLEKLVDFLVKDTPPSDHFNDDLRPWVVHKCGKPTNKAYKRLQLLGEYLGEHAVIRTDRHYSHENTCDTRLSVGGAAKHVYALVSQLRDDAEDLRVRLCKAIYDDLENTYEYLTSDEEIEELEFMFDINGRLEQCS